MMIRPQDQGLGPSVDAALEHYWQIYWASYWNSRSKQFTVPVNPVTGSNVDP